MKADFFYNSIAGRICFNLLKGIGGFKIAAWYMHTKASKGMIDTYINKFQIDMSEFEGQKFNSFSDFFKRKCDKVMSSKNPSELMSPCDAHLSVFPINDSQEIPMKGSIYTLSDLIPDKDKAAQFSGGLCLVFRLESNDYHRFHSFDDLDITETHYLPGNLHSVQPIAMRSLPVYRLNRRWWSILDTKHFGTVAQIEIGAMIVGGLTLVKNTGTLMRGEEMGNFELCGSTIVLLVNKETKNKLELYPPYRSALDGNNEVRVILGDAIGVLK